ncbi:MAG: hypothetical protein LM590_09060 [Thermofilum sp.]|nr:hypothetical protein [Thermofilum sp.]
MRAYIPTSASKYYTEEARKRLIGILGKSPDDYTMDDVYELRRIADLMVKEYYESGEKREDLLDCAGQLYAASLMMKVLYVKPKLLKAGIKPPEERRGGIGGLSDAKTRTERNHSEKPLQLRPSGVKFIALH